MAEFVADQLRGQIIRRDLADGDYLPIEAELCALFGISRPTMREAFRILEAEGLLQIRRGGRFGPQVRAPRTAVTARSLGLLLQYRHVGLGAVYEAFLDIVPPSAGRLAKRHDPSDIERLHDQRERCRAAAADPSAFLDAASAFNLLMVELAGNPVQTVLAELLVDVLQAHRVAMSSFLKTTPRVQARRVAEVLERTGTTIELIAAGDVGVESFVHQALDTFMRKALDVPMNDPVQLV
jgi:DNA-binding FadR family transcriptional regulator